jgi:hypothetical protein
VIDPTSDFASGLLKRPWRKTGRFAARAANFRSSQLEKPEAEQMTLVERHRS